MVDILRVSETDDRGRAHTARDLARGRHVTTDGVLINARYFFDWKHTMQHVFISVFMVVFLLGAKVTVMLFYALQKHYLFISPLILSTPSKTFWSFWYAPM